MLRTISNGDEINPFFIDKTFVEWFLKTEKHIDLNNEEYVISIIDNNVNMIELKKDQYIFIKNKKGHQPCPIRKTRSFVNELPVYLGP